MICLRGGLSSREVRGWMPHELGDRFASRAFIVLTHCGWDRAGVFLRHCLVFVLSKRVCPTDFANEVGACSMLSVTVLNVGTDRTDTAFARHDSFGPVHHLFGLSTVKVSFYFTRLNFCGRQTVTLRVSGRDNLLHAYLATRGPLVRLQTSTFLLSQSSEELFEVAAWVVEVTIVRHTRSTIGPTLFFRDLSHK